MPSTRSKYFSFSFSFSFSFKFPKFLDNSLTMSQDFDCYSSVFVLPSLVMMSISTTIGGTVATYSSYRLCTDTSELKQKYKCMSIWCNVAFTFAGICTIIKLGSSSTVFCSINLLFLSSCLYLLTGTISLFVLYLIFVEKLCDMFADTLFQVSTQIKCFFYFLFISQICSFLMSLVISFIYGNINILYIGLSIVYLIYIVSSITLVWKTISTLYIYGQYTGAIAQNYTPTKQQEIIPKQDSPNCNRIAAHDQPTPSA